MNSTIYQIIKDIQCGSSNTSDHVLPGQRLRCYGFYSNLNEAHKVVGEYYKWKHCGCKINVQEVKQ